MDWIQLAQDKVQGQAFVNIVMKLNGSHLLSEL
jgi:hypothetical protein